MWKDFRFPMLHPCREELLLVDLWQFPMDLLRFLFPHLDDHGQLWHQRGLKRRLRGR